MDEIKYTVEKSIICDCSLRFLKRVFDEINNRCKILIDDYESEEISDNNLFDMKLIIDDIKESIPVFYNALEKEIMYHTLLGLNF